MEEKEQSTQPNLELDPGVSLTEVETKVPEKFLNIEKLASHSKQMMDGIIKYQFGDFMKVMEAALENNIKIKSENEAHLEKKY